MPDIAITHHPGRQRFEAACDGHTAYISYQSIGTQGAPAVAFDHTVVPAALEGRGIGSQLVRHALQWAQAQALKVRADCSFVDAYIRRHPEHEALRLPPGA